MKRQNMKLINMTTPEVSFTLRKSETKILNTLISFGGQNKHDLILISDVQEEKAEQAISELIKKGFIRLNEETGRISATLPVSALTRMFTENMALIESMKENYKEEFHSSKNSVEETLNKFQETVNDGFKVLKTQNEELEVSIKEAIEEKEKLNHSQLDEMVDQVVTSMNTKITETQNSVQTSISEGTSKLDKHWGRAIDEFQNLPDSGTRSLKESITKYEQELNEIIKSSVEKINSIQTQFNGLLGTIESESVTRIQEFYSNTDTVGSDLKVNLNTGLQESRKHEKEFIKEVRQHVRTSLENDVLNALKVVISDLSKEIDNDINEALKLVVQQTDKAITASSEQMKTEFTEFTEDAKELIQEQKISLNVLETEISEITAEQKLESVRDLFLSQLQAGQTTELNQLETSFRHTQKSVIDLVESLRNSAKAKLAQQGVEFEKLLNNFSDLIDQSVSRKELDITRLQQLSQSIEQLLRNLLVSIPMRTDQFRISLKDSLEGTSKSLQEEYTESSSGSVSKIYEKLADSQQRIESMTNETLDESKNEIEKVIASSDQFESGISALQEDYLSKVENRFDQRAKVMNTELKAITRNFQQLLEGIETGVGGIHSRLTSEGVTNISAVETSLQSKLTQLRSEITTIFSQSQSEAQEFVSSLNENLQTHLERTLDVIKEGFSQVKSEYNLELSNQLEQLNSKSKEQQDTLIETIEAFSQKASFSGFKSNLEKTLEENQSTLNEFIAENRSNLDEVISLQKVNITKYQEKGPTDILGFINQIQSNATTQNKNIKDTLEDLLSYHNSFSDSTMSEVTTLIRQVHESGDKLKSILNESLQTMLTNLNRTSENIDLYYSDTLTELENQLGVASGFVTSEIDTSFQSIRSEIESLKEGMENTVARLNTDLKGIVSDSDQEFKSNVPEITKQFSSAFDTLVKEKTSSNLELQNTLSDNMTNFMTSYSSQVSAIRTKLHDLLAQFNKAIESNLENLDVIVETNISQALKRFESIYHIDSSKEDPFGLRDIHSKVIVANKRLKSVVSDSIRTQLEDFESNIPDLQTSFDAIHTQSEEDLTKSIEELSDIISSSQMTLTTDLHNYLNEEREQLDFSELRDSLKDVLQGFNEDSTQNIEQLSLDFTDSIQRAINEVNKSREEIQSILADLTEVMKERIIQSTTQLTSLKSELSTEVEGMSSEFSKNLSTDLESYNNDIEKFNLENKGNMAKFIQSLNNEIETYLSEFLNKTNEILNGIKDSHSQQADVLETLETELSENEPISYLRLLKLSTNHAINEYFMKLIEKASKQVTLYMSDPTILSSADLKSIPSEKRIWIFTNFNFSKKGKKWFTEIGKQVNINLRKSKGASNITGILAVKDEDQAVVLPDEVGFTTLDEKFVAYLLNILNMLKGSSLRPRKGSGQ